MIDFTKAIKNTLLAVVFILVLIVLIVQAITYLNPRYLDNLSEILINKYDMQLEEKFNKAIRKLRSNDEYDLEKLYRNFKQFSYGSKKFTYSVNSFLELYPYKRDNNDYDFLINESNYLLKKNKFNLDLIAINHLSRSLIGDNSEYQNINKLWKRFPESKYLSEAFFSNDNIYNDPECKSNYDKSFFNKSLNREWDIFYYDKNLNKPISSSKIKLSGSSAHSKTIETKVDINENISYLRIDPLAKSNIIIKNVLIKSLGENQPTIIHSTTGMTIENDILISIRDHYDPNFVIDISMIDKNKLSKLEITFDIAYLDMDLNKCK